MRKIQASASCGLGRPDAQWGRCTLRGAQIRVVVWAGLGGRPGVPGHAEAEMRRVLPPKGRLV